MSTLTSFPKLVLRSGFAALALLAIVAGVAAADVSRRQCIADAAAAQRSAISVARESFENAVESCRGPCQESCVNAWRTCVAPARTTRESCVNAAEATFRDAVAACRTSVGCGSGGACFRNREFQLCLVDPRVARRTAVRACLTAERATLLAAGCKSTLRSCTRACNRNSSSSSSSSGGSSSSESSSSGSSSS
jgi:hypothetical protein